MQYKQLVFSPTGGTAKVAAAIARHWGELIETVDLCDAETDFSQFRFCADDVALITLPSYAGRVPAIAAERLRAIHGGGAKCILVCVYGNRAYEDTLVEMEDIARECGFEIVAAVAAIAEHSIMHQYAAGRPDAADLSQLEAIAARIQEKLDAPQPSDPFPIPGNRPYRKAGAASLVPKAGKGCTKCGLCAAQCPVKAIDPANVKTADSKTCISCMRCVSRCPHHARTVNAALVSAVALAIKKACSVRKECELFL